MTFDVSPSSPAVASTRFKQIVVEFTAKGIHVLLLGTKPEPSTTFIYLGYTEYAYDSSACDYANDLVAGVKSSRLVMVMMDVYPVFEEMFIPGEFYVIDEVQLIAACT